MITKRRSVNKAGCIIMLVTFVFMGYLTAGIIGRLNRGNIFYAVDIINDVLKHPFRNYKNQWTLLSMALWGVGWLLWFENYYMNLKNYMLHQEYGSAQWEDAKVLTKKFSDKEEAKNRILSSNLRISINDKETMINNNLLIIGGSGAWKTTSILEPNLLQYQSSYIYTDPSGEILRRNGRGLLEKGYQIRVLNLVEMKKSDGYNPFAYIRNNSDVTRLISNLMLNTTPKTTGAQDPFWDKAEKMYLQAIFYYIYYESDIKNIPEAIKLMNKAKVNESGQSSELDMIMEELEMTSELGERHPAIVCYKKCIAGAGDTIRSIIISANSRFDPMDQNEALQRILRRDEMKLADIGMGKNGDQKTRTALFIIIPDNGDKTYNFLAGMLYSQVFQELYYQSDIVVRGRLPIYVQVWMDEFANITLPDSFSELLSTMRKRGISCSIIIQAMAQLKALFKDHWETIQGNCDTMVYLGGNEKNTHKEISEMLGKWTIDKRSTSKSFGKSESSSRSEDSVGRELLTPDEVRRMPKKNCIVFVCGQNPVYDEKYNLFQSKQYKYCQTLGEYIHRPVIYLEDDEKISIEIISKEMFACYQSLKEKGGNVNIYEINAWDILNDKNEGGLN